MIICPYCSHENIEGADHCIECQQSLSDIYMVAPTSSIEESLVSDRIVALDPKTPITVPANASVGEVLRILVENAIGAVVVVDDGKTVGIFSERDALMRLNTEAEQLKELPIGQFMTPSPRTLDIDAKIAFATHHMDLGGYRHLPIVDDAGELCGIVSARDILRYLTDKLSEGEMR